MTVAYYKYVSNDASCIILVALKTALSAVDRPYNQSSDLNSP